VGFIHLSEHLAEAGRSFSYDARGWLKSQQARLKDNQARAVLAALRSHLEPAAVRRACRYLRNRLDQVDYRGAKERGLPIGPGEIESAHRHVIQAQLKLAGCWRSPRAWTARWRCGCAGPTCAGTNIGTMPPGKRGDECRKPRASLSIAPEEGIITIIIEGNTL